MGTWGAGVFENDETIDFLADVDEGGVRALREALDRVIDAPGRPDSWAESTAIAAAAIIAAAHDGRVDLLPDDATALLGDLAANIARDPGLLDRARYAVHLVLTSDSELLELWRGSGESDAAIAAITDVQSRLSE